jgi:nucleoside-diphosphate-sugar epimerase
MKFLVTGGAGFIGSNIVETLLQRSHFVRVIDNFSTGKRENLQDFISDIDLIEGDITNIDDVKKALKDIDIVLHEAALPSVPRSIQNPINSNEVNITGTLNLLNSCRDSHVKRFVFASSSSVYGNSPTLPKHEDMPYNPLSPYAITKMTGENYCRVFSSIYGLQTVVLRYFNVFGPRQDPFSQYSAVIPKFIKAILANEQPVIFGDGTQSRDFTYVSNVVEANILAATSNINESTIVNCACHERITLNELVHQINLILGTEIKAKYDSERAGDIKHSFASIDKAKEKINYVPQVTFHEGLKKTIEYFIKHNLIEKGHYGITG